jgi:hypothetical protein
VALGASVLLAACGGGRGTVRWRFVDPRDVPASGPWRDRPAIDQATHRGS